MDMRRSIWAAMAIAYWIACVTWTSPLRSADLSGNWNLEGEELYRYEHQKWTDYEDGSIMEEEFVGVSDQPHFESQGSALQSDGKIEGHFTRKRICGEEFDFMFTGTVSVDNRVALTIIFPGESERCSLGWASWYFSYTDMIGYYDGVYDPVNKTITGTFKCSQERFYTECWDYDPWFGYDHYSVESTNIVTSGTFSITICCSDRGARPGPWDWEADGDTPDGTIVRFLEAESHERIELSQVGDHFELRYWRRGAPKGFRIAVCPFGGGCNKVWVNAPDMNHDGKPDCFASIHWTSADYVDDDCSDDYLDVIHFHYVASSCQDKLSIVQEKRVYACDPPISEPDTPCKTSCSPPWVPGVSGPPIKWWVRERPLGNETEGIFETLLEELRNCSTDRNIMMGFLSLELCDVDWDGDCDMEDCRIINSALGKCWEQPGYFPLADVNGDGCVTTSDIELMLGPRYPDVNGDGVVNLTDFALFAAHWSPGAQGGWCGMADFDTSCAVDFADLSVLADHWLEESP